VSMEEELPDLAELVGAQEAPKTKASYEYVDK
jgi:hypothetical protein